MTDGVIILSSDKIVLASGSLFTFGLGKTVFALHYKGDELRVVFDFQDDEGNERSRTIGVTGGAPPEIMLKFQNYRNRRGTMNVSPILLGTIADSSLWLRYGIYAVGPAGSDAKLVTYTYYVEDEAANGDN